MEHRGKQQQQPYRKMGQTARSLVVAATNNAFQPTTIATYLTQMWAANIMQTVGWALVGALYSTSSSRSCECTVHVTTTISYCTTTKATMFNNQKLSMETLSQA